MAILFYEKRIIILITDIFQKIKEVAFTLSKRYAHTHKDKKSVFSSNDTEVKMSWLLLRFEKLLKTLYSRVICFVIYKPNNVICRILL